MKALLLLTIHWYLSLFFQTFFLHRYCSHSMFTLSKRQESIFYYLTYLLQGISFLHPRGYAIMHIRHHQNSDQHNDPHSPHFHKNIFSMMTHTYYEYKKCIAEAKVTNDPKFTVIPIRPKLDAFSESKFNLLIWPLFYISLYLLLDIPIYYYPLILVHCLIGPIQGALVNWFGHKVGYRNYNLSDKSKNTLPLDLLLMGELYQNNHHKSAKNINFAQKWFEIDITYYIYKALVFFRVLRPAQHTTH